ncbi:FkbM family methyltransferase [Fuerstiella marisgermanici]|nr:FkbM family methyltransferase [Fuerstiella marisgermanici]
MSAAVKLKNIVAGISRSCVGRRQLIRGGRFLMNAGMLRGSNDPRTNGELDYLERMIRASGDRSPVVIDVGANYGIYCSHASKLMEGNGRIFAAEPCRATFVQLQQNTAGLPTDIDCMNVAFSDKQGEAQLYVVGAGAGTNSLEAEVTPTDATERVALMTLDHFITAARLDQVDLVKIDTEGHDYAVLCGARQGIGSGKIRALQFEYNWRWISQRSFLRDVFQLIADVDYQFGRVTPDGIEVYDQWHQRMETLVEDNYAIFHSDLGKHLKLISPPGA